MYAAANRILGNLVKVTPSSKVVGRARCETASSIGPSQRKHRSLLPGRTGSRATGSG